MEKITNYKLQDFLKIKDEAMIAEYTSFLDLLLPAKEVQNPKSRWYTREPKKLPVKSVRELTFGEVSNIRDCFNKGTIESITEAVKMVTGIEEKYIQEFTIVDFYCILSSIKQDLIDLSHMEANELASDDFDVHMEMVNAGQRMSRFGILNTINSLALDDITKWEMIEKMPYMTVFTKLMMDKEKAAIQKDVAELQKKKQQA
jgi:hypothetical protein